ncbi:MAG TPA: energy-coupling factor transporter transmembrane component T [Nocardioidaceae bacterium]|nr:energy-coupling factor transporter transmembrane component T [Nocardioidaceae bacterium]
MTTAPARTVPAYRETVVTRANPLVLLAVGLLAVVASFGVRTLAVAVAMVGVVIVLAVAMVPGLVGNSWRLLAPLLGAASVTFSTWLLAGRDESVAALAGLRVLVLALPGVLVAPFIDPSRLGDQLAQRLRLPVRPVAAVTASLQRFEDLGAVWEQLDRGRRVRGLGPGRNPVARIRHVGAMTFGLLVATLRSSARMAVAMDARGFATAHRRSWAEPAPWTRYDSAVLVGAIGFAALPYALALVL